MMLKTLMRYLPLTDADRHLMLERIAVDTVDELFVDVPTSARLPGPLPTLPGHLAEFEVERIIGGLAVKNLTAATCPSFLGAGAYRHHVPASVDQLLLRGEFLTSYTPYQPEVSQGTLQSLFEFQTQVALLTGMEVANASMYDGASACVEAVMMANRITRRGKAIVSGGLHPHYRELVQTMARSTGFVAQALPPGASLHETLVEHIDGETSCVVVQNPDFFGRLHDYTELAEACHAKGVLLVIAVTEIVSLGLIKPPGEMGADIVAAEGQGIGNALGFGGPHVGLFACKEKYLRQMPGRLCGQTVDAEGRRGYVLTLSGCAFSTVTDNEIYDIHLGQSFGGAEMAGIKFHGAIDAVISGNHIYRCGPVAGIWLDWMAQGAQVTGNLLHDNNGGVGDIFCEMQHGPLLLANNLLLSKHAFRLNAQGMAFAHNFIAGGMVNMRGDRRTTPFQRPHATEIAGLLADAATNDSGDDRFYNNLLVAPGGLQAMNQSAWPCFEAGNVFAGGAPAGKFGQEATGKPDNAAGMQLERKSDGWYLTLTEDQAWRREAGCPLVTTALLGRARVSGGAYENRDGTPVRIHTDYFGHERNETNVFPGPFEISTSGVQTFKVWPRR